MYLLFSSERRILGLFILLCFINTQAANINVTTLTDVVNSGDGVISFREAITMANTAADTDIINFDGSLNGIITLEAVNGALILQSAATINGDNRITLDGSNTNLSILSIDDLVNGATINVTLSNLTIQNADSGINAIFSRETLNITNCIFQNNGFGINMFSNPSTLTILDSQFTNHTQTVIDAKTVDIDDSQFTNNTHDSGQTSSLSMILSTTGGTLDDSTFTNNDISLKISGDNSAQFAVRNTNFNTNKKGILINSLGHVVISDSGFSGNDSDNAVSNDPGAAIQHNGSDGTLTVTNSTFVNNKAGQASGSGGAIHMAEFSGLLTIQSSTFTGNSAGSCGAITAQGGALIENQTTVDNNTANNFLGGGACGRLTINNSVISNNQASNNHGGGLSLFHPSIIKNSAITGNSAGSSSNGGGIIFPSSSIGSDSFIINSTIANNTASQGAGLRVDITPSNGRLTIINSTIVENTATSGVGGGVSYRIFNPFLTTLIQNTIIANNIGSDISSDTPSGLDLDCSNLIEDTSGLFGFPTHPTNVENLDPLLDPIANNGGFTETYALMTDSPALGGGDNTFALDELGNVLNFDQRGSGFMRLVFSHVDIGAYESNIPPTPGALNISAGPGNGPIIDPFANTQDVVAMHAKIDVSAQDAVIVNNVTFHVTGDGDDTTGINQVNLYLDQNGDGAIAASDSLLSGNATFNMDNGQVTFNLNRTIAAGTTEFWILAFDLSESACLCQDFKPTISANDIDADFSGGGVADVTGLIDGRFIEMAGGSLNIVSGNTQAGLVESNLASDMTVLSNDQFAACGPVRFSVLQPPSGSEGQFNNQSNEIDIPLDINHMAATGYTFGEKGGNYKIRAQYQTNRPFDCTTIPDFVDFDHSAAGITLTDTLMAYRATENNIRTFVQNIPAQDTFTVELDPPMLSGFSLDMVNFSLAGQSMNDATAPFVATLNIEDVLASDQLAVTATITTPNGIQKTLQVKGSSQFSPNYPLTAIALPDWFNTVEFIATGVTSEFLTPEREYSIGFEYPTDFVWTDAVDNIVALLGGAQSELGMDGFKLALTATYDLDSNSSLTGNIERDITIFNRDVTIFGEISAGFDQNFDFNTPSEPVGTIGASTSIKLGEKSFARTVLVYGVPVTVALDLAGVASIAVVGRMYLNQQLEISQFLISPEPTVQLNVSASISALMGLAKAIASANPTATAQIHLPYSTTNGLQAPKFGGRLTVELKVEGSLFFGLATAELGTAMLGPYTWGDFISRNLENKWAELTSKQILIDNTTNFVNTHAIAGDTSGNTMLLLTQDVGVSNPDSELYFQYDDGTGFSALTPLSGSMITNNSWEMDPAVTMLNSGDALAIWTNNNAPAATPFFDDILNAQDIYWSKWDSLSLTWQNSAALTSNTSADGSSDIDFNNSTNTAVAVWVNDKNPNNDPLTRPDWEIVSAIYSESTNSWGSSIAVTNDSAADYMPAVASRGDTTLLVWSEDADGELFVDPNLTAGNDGVITNGSNLDTNNSDATLVYSTFNGTTWTTKQVLYNSVSDSSYTQMADITGYNINSFIAVWVDKQATLDVLYYAVFEGGSWLPPVELLQSTEFIEDPSVTVNSGNIPTIVYRSFDANTGDGNGYGGNLYSMDITLSRNVLIPSGNAVTTITDDKDAQLFSSTALSNNQTVVAWFNRSSTDNDGILFTNNTNNASTVIVGCTELLVDDNSNQLIDRLELTISTNIVQAGEYTINADLFDSRDQFVINTQSPSKVLSVGINDLTLTILGSVIRSHGVDGIHVLKNLSLSFFDPAATVVHQLPMACSTSDLTTNAFELAPLSFDKEFYPAHAIVKVSLKQQSENLDNSFAENVNIRIWSNLDTTGISLILTETGVNTGVFEAILNLDDNTSNEINSQILAPSGAAIVARYDIGNSSQSLIAQATVITPDIIFISGFEGL